jgi:hypothetical protein
MTFLRRLTVLLTVPLLPGDPIACCCTERAVTELEVEAALLPRCRWGLRAQGGTKHDISPMESVVASGLAD